MKRLTFAVVLGLTFVIAPAFAAAFCGFYVNKAGGQLYANATRVVLMRDDKTTVLTMQNNYEGPPKDFAMVIPVPQILQKDNVKTLPHDVMDHIDKVTAPRLVEYWEERPMPRGSSSGRFYSFDDATIGADLERKKVVVEAEFTAGEYNIVILSAKEATALDTWLRQANYNIPKGAAPYFQPYIQQGMYFFVARVDASKVKFDDGKALLSPIRFHYESDEFSLPIRLGLINAKGEQDLIVYTLGKGQRYEVANRKNVFIPTNIEVDPSVKDNFAGFYESVFKRTITNNPEAVVTEYSWQANGCDPCPPGGALRQKDVSSFGGDAIGTTTKVFQADKVVHRGEAVENTVRAHTDRMSQAIEQCSRQHGDDVQKNALIVNVEFSPTGFVHKVTTSNDQSEAARCIARFYEGARVSRSDSDELRNVFVRFVPKEVSLRPPTASEFVVTRLHARYTKDQVSSDLVFQEAEPVVGGREFRKGKGLEIGATPGDRNSFQGRYIIRHNRPNPNGRGGQTVSTPTPPVKRSGAVKPVKLEKVVKKADMKRL